MNSTIDLGRQLRHCRQQQKLTQAQFAASAGIALRTLLRMEAGDPSVKMGSFERAAHALGTKIVVLSADHHRPTLDELSALYPDEEMIGPTAVAMRG